jgi:hypothetical protein
MSVAGGHESVGVGLQDLAPDEQGEGTDFQIGQRGHLIIDINDVGVAGKSAMEVARIPVEGTQVDGLTGSGLNGRAMSEGVEEGGLPRPRMVF